MTNGVHAAADYSGNPMVLLSDDKPR